MAPSLMLLLRPAALCPATGDLDIESQHRTPLGDLTWVARRELPDVTSWAEYAVEWMILE